MIGCQGSKGGNINVSYRSFLISARILFDIYPLLWIRYWKIYNIFEIEIQINIINGCKNKSERRIIFFRFNETWN